MNWWQKFKIKWAKKILNKHAPKNEFIAYINKLEEKKDTPVVQKKTETKTNDKK